MASLKSTACSRGHLLPLLVVLVICYQLVYNIILFDAVQRDTNQDECSAAAGVGGAGSPRCLEVQLFRSWHERQTEGNSWLLNEARAGAAERNAAPSSLVADIFSNSTAPSAALAAGRQLGHQSAIQAVEDDDDDEHAALHDADTSNASVKLLAPTSSFNRRQQQFDELEESIRASLNASSTNPWAQDLSRLQRRLETSMRSHIDKHHDSRDNTILYTEAQLDKLEQAIRTSLNSSSVTPWARDLMVARSRLEFELSTHMTQHHGQQSDADQMNQLRQSQLENLEKTFRTSINERSITPWAKDLKLLQARLEFQINTHMKDYHKIDFDLSKQSSAAQKRDRQARKAALKRNVTEEIAERMTILEKHLADIVSERKVWEKQLLSKYGVLPAQAVPTPAPAGFLEKRLQWSSVVASARASWRRSLGAKASVVSRKEVRHMHWSGAIPKAACITAIRSGRHTKARMMYFIDNFRLQDYEGPRQLVVVYHRSDADAAELVRAYADDSFIKGVAAGGNETFPSTASLRYGAWSSDADVIARWDFDEWHDPSRLSMQVRALALRSRPACIIRQPQHSGKIDKDGQASLGQSLIGERSWMEKHWHPLLDEERAVLETSQAASVVQLDMEDSRLASNISHIKRVFDGPQGAFIEPSKGATIEQTWNMSACLAIESSNHSNEDGDALESIIGQQLGRGTSSQFHKLMTRRNDVTKKLQLLCLEAVLEKDVKRQAFMRHRVDQMAGIRAELDRHLAATRALYGAEGATTSA